MNSLAYDRHLHGRRELASIVKCLKDIPFGSRVLDLPCGLGCLTKVLVERGYLVTAADASESQVNHARENYLAYQKRHGLKGAPVKFERRDLLATGYANDEFDGVTCIRLFHHFYESETRRSALRELRRICRGPIVLTFRRSLAVDYARYWIKDRIVHYRKLGTPLYDRVLPISLKKFSAEIADAGLGIDAKMAAVWGISSRWFLVLSRRQAANRAGGKHAA